MTIYFAANVGRPNHEAAYFTVVICISTRARSSYCCKRICSERDNTAAHPDLDDDPGGNGNLAGIIDAHKLVKDSYSSLHTGIMHIKIYRNGKP